MNQNNAKVNENEEKGGKGEGGGGRGGEKDYFQPFTMNKDLLANSGGSHNQSNVQMSNILLLRTPMRSE